MKAIALVLAALSLSAGATAVAEPVESVPMGFDDAYKCGPKPYVSYGCTASCVCLRGGCEWMVSCSNDRGQGIRY